MSRRTYRCVIEWQHRKWGPQMQKCAAEGSSIRRAINNALLAFFSDTSQRKERLDAHTHIEIKTWRVKREAAN